MKGLLQTGGTWLLIAAMGFAAQDGNSKPDRPAARANGAAANGSGFKNPEAVKGGPRRLAAPGNPVERLMAMPPEQRERVLEKLPAGQQANLRRRLERFDKLPPNERARLDRMFNAFRNLPPEKQAIVTRQIQSFNALPDDRRDAIGPVLQRLRRMPEDDRRALLESDEFKNRFSASEWQMLSDISLNFPLPGR